MLLFFLFFLSIYLETHIWELCFNMIQKYSKPNKEALLSKTFSSQGTKKKKNIQRKRNLYNQSSIPLLNIRRVKKYTYLK